MHTTSFTSESVCAGHPDKICDQVSDAIVDAVLEKDKNGRVAVETLVTYDQIILAGEVTCAHTVDFEAIARNEIKRLGYIDPSLHFTDKSPLSVYIHKQSTEIAQGVKEQGAGDQGMMFGYACNQTKELMPMPIVIAHQLVRKIDEVRENGTLPYLRPDGKSQVTVEYVDGKAVGVSSVVLAVPHSDRVLLKDVQHDLYTHVITPVLSSFGFDFKETDVVVNGTGVWHMGGPASDTGVTGRKIIVDTYGGYARVGGGAFSGKDPTKVDRSGAYAARFLAKNIVSQKLADMAEVRLAYFIGAKKPVMQEISTFGTRYVSEQVIRDFMGKLLDTSVEGIIESLDLRRPIYLPTASYGHFGRPEFPWEKVVESI